MSIKSATQDFPVSGESSYIRVTWSSLLVTDSGEHFALSQFADRSVQVTGTFGGATVVIEGSNDGTNFHTLNDPQGDPLSIGSAKIEAVSEIVVFIRPRIVGGDGTTSLNVTMLSRKSQ